MSVLDAIAKQYEGSKSGSSGTSYEQDFSKYFAVRLEDGDNNGESTIRVMPPKQGTHPVNKEGDTPFDEGHWHSVKVGGKWRKIYCRKNNDGEHCPLCEVSADLFKSWRFPHNYKGEGILDKIIPLFTKKGDITDPREGRDINIIMGRDNKGYTKVTSILSEDPGILTDPKGTKAKEWMSEETSWKDIYKAQPLEYVQLIADGETPAWDKNLNKFIAKGDDSEGETSFKQQEVKVETPVNNSSEKNDEEPF